MSWIARYCIPDGGCGCIGACDCSDQTDPHVIGAWRDIDEATTPSYKRPLVSHGDHADGSPDRSSSARGAAGQGRGVVPLPASRPRPSVADRDELAARRATRPLSNAIGDIRPVTPPSEAA